MLAKAEARITRMEEAKIVGNERKYCQKKRINSRSERWRDRSSGAGMGSSFQDLGLIEVGEIPLPFQQIRRRTRFGDSPAQQHQDRVRPEQGGNPVACLLYTSPSPRD